jgi:hypothetical protein
MRHPDSSLLARRPLWLPKWNHRVVEKPTPGDRRTGESSHRRVVAQHRLAWQQFPVLSESHVCSAVALSPGRTPMDVEDPRYPLQGQYSIFIGEKSWRMKLS